MVYRTFCDLPPELLHIILTHLLGNRASLRSCSMVCKCFRAVALEYFSQKIRIQLHSVTPGYKPLDHFLNFLRENERSAMSVKKLTLSGTALEGGSVAAIDDAMVVAVIQLLPRLRFLVLDGVRYGPPTLALQPSGPVPLQSLSILGESCPQSSLSGLVCIASLFTLGSLNIPRDCVFETCSPFDRTSLHRPLAVRKLSIHESSRSLGTRRHTSVMLEALAQALAPDSLQDVRVYCDSPKAVAAVGKLLARAGKNVAHLDVRNDAPRYAGNRTGWTDPLEDRWLALNVGACAGLESIRLYMHCGGMPDATGKPLSAVGVGVLAQAAPTLRFVEIEVHDVPRAVEAAGGRGLGLQALDVVVGSGERFPALREVTVYVGGESGGGTRLAQMVRMGFPQLVEAGKLVVREL